MIIGNIFFNDKREFYGVLKMDKDFDLKDLKKKHSKKEILMYSQKELVEFIEGATDFNKINDMFKLQDWEQVKKDWDEFNAFTANQAIRRLKKKYLHMMTAFRFMGGKEVLRILGGTVISEESVDRTLTRMRAENPKLFDIKNGKASLQEFYVDYTDVYKLHCISKDDFAKKEITSADDVYILEVIRDSTGHHQFLFVDHEEEQCQTALGAAGWTISKDDGERMTREEFLDMNNGPEIQEQVMEENKKKVYYTIVTEKPLGTMKYTNKIKISGSTSKECVEVMLYNQNLIREVMGKIKEHSPEYMVFYFSDIPGHEILFTKKNFDDLFGQWIDAMVEVENYELASELRDFFKTL